MTQNNRQGIEKKVSVKTPRENTPQPKIIATAKSTHHLADVLSLLFHRKKRRVFVERKKTAALHGLSKQFVIFLLFTLTATVTILTLFVMWQLRLAWYEAIWREETSSSDKVLAQNVKSNKFYLNEKFIPSQYSQAQILDLRTPWRYRAFYRLPYAKNQEPLILIGGEKKEEKIIIYENEHPYFNRSTLIKCLLAVTLFSVTLTALLLLWFRQKFINPLYHTVQAIHRFTDDPNNLMTMLIASDREDEIGFLQRELTRMQVMYRISLKQYQHLAALGAAVTKINHDLKGLLSTALLAGEQINKSADPKTRKKIRLFVTIVEKTIKLCGQLLSYVREEKKPTFITRVDINILLKSLSADLRIAANGETKIKTQLQSTRPIQGDADNLYRAFRNIGQNAIEAKAKELTIILKGDGKHVHVNFIDNGPGLSIEASRSLFKAFAHSSKVGGSGLGLSISQDLIKQHGGSLTLARSGAKGTTFHCVFPVALGTKKTVIIGKNKILTNQNKKSLITYNRKNELVK